MGLKLFITYQTLTVCICVFEIGYDFQSALPELPTCGSDLRASDVAWALQPCHLIFKLVLVVKPFEIIQTLVFDKANIVVMGLR